MCFRFRRKCVFSWKKRWLISQRLTIVVIFTKDNRELRNSSLNIGCGRYYDINNSPRSLLLRFSILGPSGTHYYFVYLPEVTLGVRSLTTMTAVVCGPCDLGPDQRGSPNAVADLATDRHSSGEQSSPLSSRLSSSAARNRCLHTYVWSSLDG